MAYTNAELLVMSSDIYMGVTEQSKLPFLANTRWSREATDATEVNILSVGDVTFETYVPGTPLTPLSPAPGSAKLKMDQLKGVAIASYDTQKLVAGYVQAVAQKAALKAATLPDNYIINTLLTKALFPTNWYAGTSDAGIEINGANALDILEDLGENLAEQNVMGDRVIVAPPSITTKIRIAMRKAGLLSEQITNVVLNRPDAFKVSGFTILTSNQFSPVGGTGTDYNIFYGTADAIACGYNPMSLESQRMVLEPGDNVFGVLRFGAKVVDEKSGGVAYLQAKAEA
jgi:hypothetical protein